MNNAPDSWTSNSTLADIARTLAAASSVLVTTHVKPDGDAVGSSLALVRALLRKGASAQAVYFGPKPGWFKAVLGQTPALDLDAKEPLAFEPDAIVVIDTGSWVQIEPIAPWLKTRTDRTIVRSVHFCPRERKERACSAACLCAARTSSTERRGRAGIA